jgi:hypothetical protein
VKIFRLFFIITAYCIIIFPIKARSRDLNLDWLYVIKNTPQYGKILDLKLDMYSTSGSEFIDRDVIFAYWVSGTEIIYVQEHKSINIICVYEKNERRRRELARISGAVLAARYVAGSKYIFIKRIALSSETVGITTALDIKNGSIIDLGPKNPYLDFTLSYDGRSMFYEDKRGIVEWKSDTGAARYVKERNEYPAGCTKRDLSLIYLSPDRSKELFINGSGGNYKAYLTSAAGSVKVKGISSISEIFWLDNRLIAYRTGSPGDYRIVLYDTSANTANALASKSLNTNLSYSQFPKILAYAKDQIIHLYGIRDKSLLCTGLEGEDVICSPDGNRFISLYLNKLFISSISAVKKNTIGRKRIAREIAGAYSVLLKAKEAHKNEYSGEYIMRKQALYKKISED